MGSLARWGSLLVLAAPLQSWALSVGNIESNSYLNERLDAVIPLTATEEELNGLRVAMAPMAQFAATGLEYASVLGAIDLRVERNSRGEPVIRLSSSQLITETFLTMLIEVRSGRSTVYSEQTILLDPPTFLADEVPAAPVAAPVTREVPQAVGGGQIARQPAAPAPQPAVSAPAAAAPPAPIPAPTLAAGDYTVQGGDTLWDLVQRVRPAGVTTNQAMVAVFEANPSAFSGNINRLRRGAILRIPPAAQLGAMSAAAATAEVARQNEAWRGGAQTEPRLVLIPPSEDAGAGGALAPAADSGRVAELEDEVSDLSTELAATRARLAEAERLLELRSAELANVQSLADQAEEAEPEAGSDEIFVDEEVADDAAAATGEAAVEADEPEVAAPVAAAERAAAVATVSTVDSGPSLLEQIIAIVSKPIVLGVVAVIVVLIGALAFLRRRREEDFDDVTGKWQALESELEEEAAQAESGAQAAAAPLAFGYDDDLGTDKDPLLGAGFDSTDAFDETGGDLDSASSGTMEIPAPAFPDDDDDITLGGSDDLPLADQTLSSQTVINLDHDDPIAEADFHMAYGLYDQAAELLTRSLGDEPDNQALRLKLLEVFFVWGNKESFLEQAQLLRSTLGGGAQWDKVVIMGKQICPDEPLFAVATAAAAAGEVDLDLEASPDSAGLDFAFGESAEQGVDLDLEIEDADDADRTPEASGAREQTVETIAGDETLDIGERTQAGLEAALFMEDDEDEDAAADAYADTAEAADASADADDDSGDFTLDATPEAAPAASSTTMVTPALRAEGTGSFESGDTVEQPRPAAAEMTAEIELDDLGLDLGDIDELPDASGENDEVEDGSLGSSGIDFVLDGPAPYSDSTLSATGVTQVLDVSALDDPDAVSLTGTAVLSREDQSLLSDDDDADDMDALGSSTEVLENPVGGFGPEPPETEDDLDLNLDDFSSALGSGSDTVEHNVSATFSDIDLDVGADVSGDEEPTGTEEYSPLDPQTMTEVGTKLDLARAYIDMGDPEGAKSILEEVLSEGDAGQRNEAKALISGLSG